MPRCQLSDSPSEDEPSSSSAAFAAAAAAGGRGFAVPGVRACGNHHPALHRTTERGASTTRSDATHLQLDVVRTAAAATTTAAAAGHHAIPESARAICTLGARAKCARTYTSRSATLCAWTTGDILEKIYLALRRKN